MPFYIILISSFKSDYDATATLFQWWPEHGLSLEGYQRVVRYWSMIFNGLKNTLLYHLPTTLIGVFVNALASYGFAKLTWKGKQAIFSFLMLTLMLPSTILSSSNRLYMSILKWDSTALPIIIPGMFGGFGTVFFLRQYMMAIPDDLLGAAKIDGMSDVEIFFTLIIPLSMPPIITQIVTVFISAYNSYLGPLIYLSTNPDAWTIQLVLKWCSEQYQNLTNVMMAFCVVGMFPLILLYISIQDFILNSVRMTSGLKG
jgi:multiple sugar transport system permease protein